jgi:hypothetical protein
MELTNILARFGTVYQEGEWVGLLWREIVNKISLCYYRLGVRLEQALLLYQHAEPGMATDDVLAVRDGLCRLGLAFDFLSSAAALGTLKENGERAIRDVSADWESFSTGRVSFSSVEKRLQSLADLVREQAGPPYLHWFDLGLEIVQVEGRQIYPKPVAAGELPAEGTTRVPCPDPRWVWRDPGRLNQLLADLNIKLERLFVDIEGDDSKVEQRPNFSSQFLGWYGVEGGLRAMSMPSPPGSRLRPCFERDRQLLEWYEDERMDTFHSPAKIRDRWKEQDDEEITIDVIKKAIAKARKERHDTLNR